MSTIDFFRWIPADRYLLDSDPGGTEPSRVAVVLVTSDLIAEHNATLLPPGPVPVQGFYVLHWDESGLTILPHRSRKTAVMEARELAGDAFDGEDEGDLPEMVTLSVDKPSRVVAAAEAVVETRVPLPFETITLHGLAALDESPRSLFGWGVRGHRPGTVLEPGTYTVYANRD
jgi:hypothetical protein